MKQFLTFITEARITKASSQAKRLGLVGDGHGDWYDRQGNLKAKTIAGELKMFSGRQASGDQEDKERTPYQSLTRSSASTDAFLKTPRGASLSAGGYEKQTGQDTGGTSASIGDVGSSGPLTIAFDKFDDESVTNNVLAAVEELAGEDIYYIFPSRDSDIEGLKNAYPEISESIIDDKNAETIYDVLQSLYENGFDAINIVVRKSRAQQISNLAYEQNGQSKLYNFTMLNVIPVDERTIREQYLAGDIFKIGSVVESKGHTGEVFRRGANHLICIDEQKEVFRTWISEATELSKFDLPIEF